MEARPGFREDRVSGNQVLSRASRARIRRRQLRPARATVRRRKRVDGRRIPTFDRIELSTSTRGRRDPSRITSRRGAPPAFGPT
jgi:hypothetical protein